MLESIPPLLLQFTMTAIFSFIVGLEFHSYLRINQYEYKFGSIRTFVLIGLLGFLLVKLDVNGLYFSIGLAALSGFLALYYAHHLKENRYSLFEILVALLVFLIGPITVNFPAWFLVLFVVLLVMMLGEKPLIHQFSNRLANDEVVTLAKFLVIAGVILPLLPDKQLSPALPVTFYKAWLAVIVVSGFSYLSYLAQTYFFKTRGLLLTGLLGGLYSSTATSVVIGRRARDMANDRSDVSSAVIMATAMMYLRLLLIIFFLDVAVAKKLALPFSVLIVLSFIVVMALLRFTDKAAPEQHSNAAQHPLELTTASLFALLFIFFAYVTQYVTSVYGDHGLHFLAVVVGFTDIDPFILSLLSGKFPASEAAIVSSVMIATGSNNLLKAAYIAILARNRSVLAAFLWLLSLFAMTLIYAFAFA
jgi:uncharacterized membrane protein (DUF4010 family)